MILKTKKILGIDVTISSKKYILEEIRKYLKQFSIFNFQFSNKRVKPFIIFTPNPEIINYAQKNDEFARIVNTAQINLPDGAGVVWAMKKLYGIKVEKIAGVGFMLELVKMSQDQSFRIGLIGGRGNLAVATLECLRKKHPGLSGWAMGGPEVEITNYKLQITNKIQNTNDQIREITDKIIKEKTDILFVALGFPKQEYFIDLIKQQLAINNYQSPIVLMAVGGSFDYISGRVPRAPLIIRNLGLEWLFRLVIEPWRLLRQIKGAAFFWRVAKPS